MRDAQKPIAEWMRAVMAQKEITPYAWAKKAGLGRDTVSRAIRDDYQSVTNSTTIFKLAQALNVPPPGVTANGHGAHGMTIAEAQTTGIPSEEVLAEILRGLLPAIVQPLPSEPVLRATARALRKSLVFLQAEPGVAGDPEQLRLIARFAAAETPQQDN